MLNQIRQLNNEIYKIQFGASISNLIFISIAIIFIIITFIISKKDNNNNKGKDKIIKIIISWIICLVLSIFCVSVAKQKLIVANAEISNNYGEQEKETINKHPTTLIFNIPIEGNYGIQKIDSYYVFLNDKQTKNIFNQIASDSFAPLNTHNINYNLCPSEISNMKFNGDFLIAKTSNNINSIITIYSSSHRSINKLNRINSFCLNDYANNLQVCSVKLIATNKLFCDKENNYQSNKINKALSNMTKSNNK